MHSSSWDEDQRLGCYYSFGMTEINTGKLTMWNRSRLPGVIISCKWEMMGSSQKPRPG